MGVMVVKEIQRTAPHLLDKYVVILVLKNGVQFTFSLCSHCVGIDAVNDPLDPQPNGQIRKYLHDAAVVGEG